MNEDVKKFNLGEFDFGEKPADRELTPSEKQIAAMSMGINAAIVQFVLEGFIPYAEQVHFMGHLQDFTSRIYRGEAVKMPGTTQTLKLDSKAGNLFLDAAINALEHGEENFKKLNEWAKELKQRQAEGNDDPVPTEAKPQTLH